MSKLEFKHADALLTEMIIETEIKLLEEGLFDFFKNPSTPASRRRSSVKKMDRDQKNKERQRLYYINKELPVPASLHKKELRKYYVRNRIPVPKFLQGAEGADSDPRGDEEGVDNLVTFFAKKLNMHPKHEKKIKAGLKSTGAGITKAGSFLGNLYKKVTGTDFFPGGNVPPPEELTDMASGHGTLSGSTPTAPSTSPTTPSSTITFSGYSSSLKAGLPGKYKMYYLYIVGIKDFMISKGVSVTPDLETAAKNFIKNHVEKDVFNFGKTEVIPEKFANGKQLEWGKIADFIKNETSNDKSDMKLYQCGHYYVGKTAGKLELLPIGQIPGVNEGELK